MLSKVDSLLGCPSIDNSIESKLSFTDANQKRFFCWCHFFMHKLASLGSYGTTPNAERDLFAFARQAGLSVNSWLHVYLVPVRICRDTLVGEETVDWPVLLPHEWFGELWERSLQLWSKYVLGTNEHAAIGKFWETVANSPLAGAAPDGKPGLIKMLLWKVLTNC